MIFHNMIGRVMESVTGKAGDGEMVFKAEDGSIFRFTHYQDCCESVDIVDVAGDLEDLVGYPLVQAEEVSNEEVAPLTPEEDASYGTWTFYKFATRLGYVTVRWLGTSNGYYSESVHYVESLNDVDQRSV